MDEPLARALDPLRVRRVPPDVLEQGGPDGQGPASGRADLRQIDAVLAHRQGRAIGGQARARRCATDTRDVQGELFQDEASQRGEPRMALEHGESELELDGKAEKAVEGKGPVVAAHFGRRVNGGPELLHPHEHVDAVEDAIKAARLAAPGRVVARLLPRPRLEEGATVLDELEPVVLELVDE